MRTRSTIESADGTVWYYEQEGAGPDVVLIPDGFGDCQLFDRAMTLIAVHGFRATTFDMPGLSRSHRAPPHTYQAVTAQRLAQSVVGVLDALNIGIATVWGSSSGGSTVLALIANHPDRIRNGLAHEVPTTAKDNFSALLAMDDEDLSNSIANVVPNGFVGSATAWDALGDDVHARLRQNYPRWARGYISTVPTSVSLSQTDLNKRPLDWTVGTSTPTGYYFDNIIIACKAGVPISTIPGMHFPYVSHPQEFADHIVTTTQRYL